MFNDPSCFMFVAGNSPERDRGRLPGRPHPPVGGLCWWVRSHCSTCYWFTHRSWPQDLHHKICWITFKLLVPHEFTRQKTTVASRPFLWSTASCSSKLIILTNDFRAVGYVRYILRLITLKFLTLYHGAIKVFHSRIPYYSPDEP